MNSMFNRLVPWPVSVVPTKLPQPNNSRHHQRHNVLIIKVNTNVDIRLFKRLFSINICDLVTSYPNMGRNPLKDNGN